MRPVRLYLTCQFAAALVLTAVLIGCRSAAGPPAVERPEYGEFFEAAGLSGTFVLRELQSGQDVIYNPARAREPFLPASTFKILNALIALETGVIEDDAEIIAWDGVSRGYEMWDQDHTLRTAMRYSAVWFYQELARRIGAERMQRHISEVGYGNEVITGGLDRFWLEGGLRISAVQQVNFLERLYRSNLPFSDRSMESVRDILILEETPDYTLRAKTGWAGRVNPEIGWFVGYVERGERVAIFALNIDIESNEDATARERIARTILAREGLLP